MQVHAEVVITSQMLDATVLKQYQRFELTFSLNREYDNPYDADTVAIDALFTEPDGTTRVVPAFFSMGFDVVPGSPERYENGRSPAWKVRFTPTKVGEYTYGIRIADATGMHTVSGDQSFTCTPGNAKGFLGIDPNDPQMLRHDTGQPYLPIGHNIGWAPNDTGLAWWKSHFDACAAAGINWARIWMCHFNGGQNLEWSSTRGPYWHGVGQISQEIAFKIDRIVEMAEARGIAIQLVLQHHGQFSSRINPNWNENPYNKANAADDDGWLGSPEAFFTDPKAQRLTRNRYRYIVARWGYSTAIHSWELWNEVQWTDGWTKNREAVIAWHQEMAQFLHAVDPFDHLITTSSDFMRTGDLWASPNIDLVQMHAYTESILPAMQKAMERLRCIGKPVIMAEYGLQAEGEIPELHPDTLPEPKRSQIIGALHLHNGIWAAFHMKSGGHLWWWDSYIEKRDLFPIYTPLSRYAQDEDPGAQHMAPITLATTTPLDEHSREGNGNILHAIALAGESAALLWIHDTGSQYGNRDHGEIAGATVQFLMPDGDYTIEYWNTWGEGGISATNSATSSDDKLVLALPRFHRDIAIKVKSVTSD